MKSSLYFVIFLFSFLLQAQQKKIEIIHADHTFTDEAKYPQAIVVLGNVMVEHSGATLQCKQALIYQKANIVKAFGDVLINQGDTLTQTSKYVDYNGNTKVAKSWGNVILKDPKMTLTTDTLRFDRAQQLLYYDDYATITDFENTLKSKVGKYYLKESKFEALSNVIITNPDHTITSDQLTYYTNSGFTYLFGPSTIKDSVNTLYCENGFHDSKKKISIFTKRSKIDYKNRIIEADSMYYDKTRQYASAHSNIVVTDTLNKIIVKGQFSEYYEAKDSVYIIGKPYALNYQDQDSTYIHGDTLMITGKPKERILRAYHRVKFFNKELQGKCDSLYTNESLGITKMFRRPVLWNANNQISGDSIYFTSNIETNELDSLKVYHNAFVISKDSLGDGYSQIKGRLLFGKFVKDTLDNVLVLGNGQMINYNRDENKELVGITKVICSDLSFKLIHGKLNEVRFITKPDGKTYPESQFPEEERKLPGFEWRVIERPLKWEDIFIRDEGDDEKIKALMEAEKAAILEKKKLDATTINIKEKNQN